MPSLAGQSLDKYNMLEEVGHGGMAVVYRGVDAMLDREVAVKVLHPHLAGREESRQRLRREALTVAKLRHENIVEIYDYSGPEAEESYIVTEFIHGDTLRDWLDDRWSPHPVLAALVVYRLCLALEHAHALGIVHRDIKPENVMIRMDGCLKLMDFGIAQILDAQKLTMTGQLLGSPAYMAPELISGKPVDKRTDLFACGVLLYQLSTGALPFSGRNPHEVLHRISDGEYTSPQSICSKVDDGLVCLIDHALATDPDDRFSSAQSMANAIEDYLRRFDIEVADFDLRAFFREPEKARDELDQALCGTLLAKARAEAKEGHRSRALGMLGQVLEFDPENRSALNLIEDVKARGRRSQILLFGGLALAVAGFVAAGVVLIRAEVVPPNAASAANETSQDKHRTTQTIIPTRNTGDSRPNVGPTRPATGLTQAGDTPTAPPNGTPTKATFVPKKINTGLVPCAIEVKGLPAVQRSKYKLATNAKNSKPRPLTGGVATLLLERKKNTTVRLTGKGQYEASRKLNADQCASGKLVLQARPRNARVQFSVAGVQIPLQQLSLRCKGACWVDQKNRPTKTANERFEFKSPDNKDTEWFVTVLVQGSGVKEEQISFKVSSSVDDKRQMIRLALKPF